MFGYVIKAIKTKSPIVLLLEGEGGKVISQRVRPSRIVGDNLIGYSFSAGTDREFSLAKILGLHHWFEE